MSQAVRWVMRVAMLVALAAGSQQSPTGSGPYASWTHGPGRDASYFPIAVWLQSPSNAARYRAAGINLYVGLWNGPTEEQLAELQRAGMPVICEQNQVGLRHRDDPTIVGWMHGDEPDNAQPVLDPATGKQTYGPCIPPTRIVSDYERLRATDPTRPILLNLGQGVANDQWIGRGSGASLKDYETYVKGGDIVSFDVYPVAELPQGDKLLWYVPKGVGRLIGWTGGRKPIWTCIECTGISGERKATPQQVRSEVWMALIHGARGLVYFVHQFKPTFDEHALLDDPEMLREVTAVNRQVTALAPVLNGNSRVDLTVASSSLDVPIDAMARRHGGSTYVFACGMRNGDARGSFTIKGLPRSARADVLGERRTIEVADGRFSDTFDGFGVHLYRIVGR